MAKSPERTYNYKVSQKKPKLTKEQKRIVYVSALVSVVCVHPDIFM